MKKVIIELEINSAITDERIEQMVNDAISTETINWLYDMPKSQLIKFEITTS